MKLLLMIQASREALQSGACVVDVRGAAERSPEAEHTAMDL